MRLFLVITAEPEKDFDIPTEGLTFGTLIRAQALGDYEALIEAKKKVIRVHLPNTKAMAELPKHWNNKKRWSNFDHRFFLVS